MGRGLEYCAMKTIAAVLILAGVALGQGQQSSAPEPGLPALKNHQILLAPPSANGTAYTVFVAPDGKLAILPTSQIVELIKQGYRPFTFGELQDAITQLFNLNAAMNAELTRLQNANAQSANAQSDHNVPETHTPTREETEGHERAARQQADMQRRQLMLMYLLGQQPQRMNMNVTVKDCTKTPALCVQQ